MDDDDRVQAIVDGVRPCTDDPNDDDGFLYAVYDDDANREVCCRYHAYEDNEHAYLM